MRTIKELKKQDYNKEVVQELYAKRTVLKSNPNSKENIKELKKVQEQINNLQFIPELVSVQMDKIKDYEGLFENGFTVNGTKYKRFMCSAGMGRRCVALFCSEKIIDKLTDILDCGRDKTIPIVPNKYNAYFSLSSSNSQVVSEPRIVVVPDYENKVKFRANFVTETDYEIDDIVEEKDIEESMNRTDGMGLISPVMAQRWALDLELDYLPSQFVVRQAFLKGLVTVFDFHKFCEEKNEGNYMVKSIYKDENGKDIYVDLKEVDIILSESQFKLWNSYNSLEHYIEEYRERNLTWGVTQCSPEEYSNVNNLNYQFLQVLDLDDDGIEDICSLFFNWIKGVTTENLDYSLLYLLGRNTTEKRVIEYLKSSENYWIKSLIVNKDLINDKYVRERIYDYLKTSINNACLGTIPIEGNFQYIVTDPYAYMEYVCGQEPKGLLKEGEYFSNYWNRLDIDKVVGMRAPLTHFSEVNVMDLIDNEETKEWYKWCKNGIILNWHGYDCVIFAGADKLLSRKLLYCL